MGLCLLWQEERYDEDAGGGGELQCIGVAARYEAGTVPSHGIGNPLSDAQNE